MNEKIYISQCISPSMQSLGSFEGGHNLCLCRKLHKLAWYTSLALKILINYILLNLKSHWLHSASIIRGWLVSGSWERTKKREWVSCLHDDTFAVFGSRVGIEGPPICSNELSTKRPEFFDRKILRNCPRSQFFKMLPLFNHGIVFWTEYVTAMDLLDIRDFRDTVFVGVWSTTETDCVQWSVQT